MGPSERHLQKLEVRARPGAVTRLQAQLRERREEQLQVVRHWPARAAQLPGALHVGAIESSGQR